MAGRYPLPLSEKKKRLVLYLKDAEVVLVREFVKEMRAVPSKPASREEVVALMSRGISPERLKK